MLDRPPADLSVAFIPTAADTYDDKWFIKDDRDELVRLGFKIIDVRLEGNKEELQKKLQDVDIIFVAGGNTFYLLQKARETGFDSIVAPLVEKGVVYIGSSAGSALAGTSIEPMQKIDDPSKAPNLKSFSGLGLFNYIVLPHYGSEKYQKRIETILNDNKNIADKIVKITDNEAISVKNDKWKIVQGDNE